MKILKYFFGMLLIVSVFSMVSCKDKDNPEPPDFGTADYPEAPKVDGKITIFAKFEAEVCGEIVLPGSYHQRLKPGKDDEYEWDITDVSKLAKFVSAGIIDGKDWGAEGWWKVTVDVTASSAIPEHNAVLGVKPVQLESGKFDWMFQIGDENTVEVKSGDIEVKAGYSGECNIYMLSNATAAFIFKAWKNNPCAVVRHDYTFNVTVPAGTPSDADVYISGDMNGWEFNKLTKSGSQYSIKINNVMEGAGYKYALNATWNNEELAAAVAGEDCAEAIGNRITGTSATINDEVKNWRGITIDKCGDGTYPDVDAVAGKITIFAKFETELCGEVGLVGTNNNWSDKPENLPRFVPAGEIDGKDWGALGWWKITVDLNAGTAFDYDGGGVLSAKPVQLTSDGAFVWDYQIGYDEEGDIVKLSGTVDVVETNPGECNMLYRTNTTAAFIFKKWKNDPCVLAPKHNVTFSVTVPEATGDAAVRIVGSFGASGYPDWKEGADEMILTKGGDGKYSITLSLNEGNIEYKYVVNGTWDNEEQTAECGGISNRKLTITGATTQGDVVPNWKGLGNCAPGVKHDYTFVVTVPEGTPEGAVIRIVGDFGSDYPKWNEKSDDMILTQEEDGTYSITLEGVPEGAIYKYVLNGTWDNVEMAATDGACAADVGNRITGDEETIEDTVENWKEVTTCLPVPITATADTWEIGDQIWTDYIVYDGKGKVAAGTITNYAGTNTVGDYRNNPGYKGYMYNLPYIQANEDKLCPAPWRVTSPQDIIDLDIALGGDGTNYHEDAGTAGAGHDPNIGDRVQRYVDEFGWEFSGRVYADGSINTAGGIGNLSTNAGASATVIVDGGSFTVDNYANRPSHLCVKTQPGDRYAIFPQNEANSSNQKERAFPVRCVKDAE